MKGANGAEFTAEGSAQYRVLEDGCADGANSWDKTVIEYSTTKTAQLPVTVNISKYQ